jgi:FlaA1/EpsC-like NDP-sugar epimerase
VDRWLGRHRRACLILLDALAWVLSLTAFSALRYLDVLSGPDWDNLAAGTAVAVGLQMISGTALWIYDPRNVVGSKDDAIAVAEAVVVTSVLLEAITLLFPGGRLMPASVPLAASAGVLTLGIGGRLLWRTLHEVTVRPMGARPALILGAGSAGTQLVANMLADPDSPFMPVGLLDDDPAKCHLRIHGIPVLGNRRALEEAMTHSDAEVLIIAIPSARSGLYREVSETARDMGLKVKVLPNLRQILTGKVGLRDLRDIDITDLLGRDPVDTDVAASAGYITGKRVLVTGAGGSIGSELCRQLVGFEPAALLMLDRDESALHSLQLSISGHGLLDTDDVILADIRDRDALSAVFAKHQPEVIFHAAALKHLPMLEQYPEEAWKTNVLGTANVLEAARAVGVEVFVNISTDKAASPTSVLGHSKRFAERLTAGVAAQASGKFVSVRFGNVLGSRGSVLPAFADQIARGGPVTVTHPDVTRFFMMIPEACELVIQAAAVGRDGEAMVLQMGQPVRILDVAEQMIEMSGRTDIDIVFCGLRHGEKMHEDLFGQAEGQRTTSHSMIDAVPVPPLGIPAVRTSPVCWDEANASLAVAAQRKSRQDVEIISVRRTSRSGQTHSASPQTVQNGWCDNFA